MVHSLPDPTINAVKYRQFKTNKWPKRTNRWCWWCFHGFDERPFPLPVQYNKYTKKYKVTGIFCSPNCAMSYARLQYKKNTHFGTVIQYIKQIAKEQYGYSDPITYAPDRELLLELCGHENGMNIKDFRAASRSKKTSLMRLELPYVTCERIVIEDTDHIKTTQEKNKNNTSKSTSSNSLSTSSKNTEYTSNGDRIKLSMYKFN